MISFTNTMKYLQDDCSTTDVLPLVLRLQTRDSSSSRIVHLTGTCISTCHRSGPRSPTSSTLDSRLPVRCTSRLFRISKLLSRTLLLQIPNVSPQCLDSVFLTPGLWNRSLLISCLFSSIEVEQLMSSPLIGLL